MLYQGEILNTVKPLTDKELRTALLEPVMDSVC